MPTLLSFERPPAKQHHNSHDHNRQCEGIFKHHPHVIHESLYRFSEPLKVNQSPKEKNNEDQKNHESHKITGTSKYSVKEFVHIKVFLLFLLYYITYCINSQIRLFPPICYTLYMETYHADREYLALLKRIMAEGAEKTDRTGTGTKSIFGHQMRFDLSKGFPLLTTKKVPLKAIIHELIWFVRGDSNLQYLAKNNVHIWDEWPYKAYLKRNNLPIPEINGEEWTTGMKAFVERVATDDAFAQEYGNLGPIYGYQWRSWPTPNGGHIDQLKNVIEQIKNSPDSRRMIVSAWNVADIDEMAKAGLPPCHCLFQFYVANGKLSCQLYQRSCDTFLGVPFNIASYALLTMMLAQVCGLEAGDFVWTGGDVHIYSNHFEQVATQLSRENDIRPMPKMTLNPERKNIEDFTIDDFTLTDYNPHDAIKAPIAV